MFKKVIIAAVCLGLGLFNVQSVSADEAKPAVWLQISPVANRVSLKAGESLEYIFNIDNIGGEGFRYKVYATPYSVTDNSYELDFSKETSRTQISRWITFKQADGTFANQASFSIEPGKKQEIVYRITVPKDVPTGGQYATIFAESEPRGGNNNTGIRAIPRVGLVIFGRTEGQTKDSAEIIDYSVPTFLTNGKFVSSSTVKNSGNTDFEVSSSLVVEKFFGGKVYEHTTTSAVLPDTSRTVKESWEETPAFGIFRVTSSFSALDQIRKESKLILIIPTFLIIITLILLTIIITWLIILIRKRRLQKTRLIV